MARKTPFSRTITNLDKGTFKRVLRVRDLFAIGYGDLGSSIYYALGITALYALGATPIALAMAGVVFVCTALTYAEMTSMYPESGGSASFARHAFNDLISFIAGWGLLFDYIVTIAISAFAVAPYLAFINPSLKIRSVEIGFAIGLILLLFLLNFFGVRQSTRMSWILAAFAIGVQLLVIGVSCFTVLDIPAVWEQMWVNQGTPSSPTWPEFWKGTAMAMVAYTGIESIAQLGAESKKPTTNLPRAIVLAMIVLVAMYLGISFTALSAISPHELGTTYTNDPIAGIAAALPVGGQWLGVVVALPAAFILIVASNAGLLGSSRLAFNLGEFYQLPRFFYHSHKRFRTPYMSLAFFALVAIIIILFSRGKLMILADLYNFGAMIGFFFAHLSLIVLRIKSPDYDRPFRIRFCIPFRRARIPITAIIGLIATFSIWMLIVLTKPEGRIFGLAWMIGGISMYVLYRKQQKLEPAERVTIEKIKLPAIKTFPIKKILFPMGRLNPYLVNMACELAQKHHARLFAIHVIEVPYSMPLDMLFPQKVLSAGETLRTAEAIAREYQVPIDLQIVRSRSIVESVLHLAKNEKYDLIVLGESVSHDRNQLGTKTARILQGAPCRVLYLTT